MALFRTRSAAVFGIDAHFIDVEVDMYPGGARAISSRWACRISRCARAASASSPRCSIRASAIPTNRSPSIWRRPTCARKARGSICRWRWEFWARWGVVAPDDHLFVGELSLDGTLRPVRGALSIAVVRAATGASRIWWCRPTTEPRRRSPKACACSAAASGGSGRVSPAARVGFSRTSIQPSAIADRRKHRG